MLWIYGEWHVASSVSHGHIRHVIAVLAGSWWYSMWLYCLDSLFLMRVGVEIVEGLVVPKDRIVVGWCRSTIAAPTWFYLRSVSFFSVQVERSR